VKIDRVDQRAVDVEYDRAHSMDVVHEPSQQGP
jgi:hypothetical protein